MRERTASVPPTSIGAARAGGRWLSLVVRVLLAGILALAAAEVAVRAYGGKPWKYVGLATGIPPTHAADPVLGWHPKPGRYEIPPFSPRGAPTTITIGPERTRSVGRAPRDELPTLALFGDSFTFGWAVSDEETYAARLQERLPSWTIQNWGVQGYGTYQSLLRMRRYLASHPPPARILYGYFPSHEIRNVAHPVFTSALEQHSRHGLVAMPFATVDEEGRLIEHPPEAWPDWPLKEHLAIVSLLREWWMYWSRGGRLAQARDVMHRILLEMMSLVQRHGSSFGVVLLSGSPEQVAHYENFLAQHEIETIDCARRLTPDLQVPGDGHANARLHSMWAECIAAALTAS